MICKGKKSNSWRSGWSKYCPLSGRESSGANTIGNASADLSPRPCTRRVLFWCPSLFFQFDFFRPRVLFEPHRAALLGLPVAQSQPGRPYLPKPHPAVFPRSPLQCPPPLVFRSTSKRNISAKEFHNKTHLCKTKLI